MKISSYSTGLSCYYPLASEVWGVENRACTGRRAYGAYYAVSCLFKSDGVDVMNLDGKSGVGVVFLATASVLGVGFIRHL